MYLTMVMALAVMYMMVNGIKTTGQTSLCIQPEQTLFVRLRRAAVATHLQFRVAVDVSLT